MQAPHDLENETNFIALPRGACAAGYADVGYVEQLTHTRTQRDAQIVQLFAALCNCTRQHSFLLHKEQCVRVCVCEGGERQERDKATIRICDKNLTRLSARSGRGRDGGNGRRAKTLRKSRGIHRHIHTYMHRHARTCMLRGPVDNQSNVLIYFSLTHTHVHIHTFVCVCKGRAGNEKKQRTKLKQ